MKESDSDSTRPQEQSYEAQIRSAYRQHLGLFLTHSSDLLHLKLVPSSFRGSSYNAVIATSQFSKYDVILEVRGSVITKQKLFQLLKEDTVRQQQLPLLLRLNEEKGWLLSPKNISKWLFVHPVHQQRLLWSERGNCYIQNHYGTKLFVIAGRDILKGEELILDQDNYSNSTFRLAEE